MAGYVADGAMVMVFCCRWESENKNMEVLIILKVQINSANKSKVKIISANNYQSENK